VIGPSGVGKSSLLRAGLLPALAAGDLPIEGSACWPQLYLRPGPDPLGELARHVETLGVDEQDLPAAIRADPTALRCALQRVVDAGTVDSTAAHTTTAAVAGAAISAAEIPTEVGAPAPAAGRRGRPGVIVVGQLQE